MIEEIRYNPTGFVTIQYYIFTTLKSIFNCKFHRIGDEFRADVVTKRCSLLRKGEKLMYNKYIIIYFSDLFHLFRSKCTRKYHMNILDCTRLYSDIPALGTFGYFQMAKIPKCTIVLLWYFCSTAVVLFAIGCGMSISSLMINLHKYSGMVIQFHP